MVEQLCNMLFANVDGSYASGEAGSKGSRMELVAYVILDPVTILGSRGSSRGVIWYCWRKKYDALMMGSHIFFRGEIVGVQECAQVFSLGNSKMDRESSHNLRSSTNRTILTY